MLELSSEVATALDTGQPVVALESTIISHGMPYPRNVETALAVEDAVRTAGATPATVAVLDGKPTAGLTRAQIEAIGHPDAKVIKCSRRDLPFAAARALSGATTVAATMIIAAMANIRVFATGGIGGVHRDVEATMDISADLEELARTDVVVVCAGIKSILDIPRTLEYLETKGVPVVGYQTDTLPAFFAQSSGYHVDYRVNGAEEIAEAFRAKRSMQIQGGMLIGVPIPAEHALADSDMNAAIDAALAQMLQDGTTGKDITPYLLAKIVEQTDGKSLDANVELILNNARIAAAIAAAMR